MSTWVPLLLLCCLTGNAAIAAEQPRPMTTQPAALPLESMASRPKSIPNPLLPPIEPGQSKAARWLHLLDQASLGDSWQEPPQCREQAARDRTEMCRLQWRKQSGLSSLRGRYEDYSYDMKLRFAGKHLADHLEFDVDHSPEVRLRYEFE